MNRALWISHGSPVPPETGHCAVHTGNQGRVEFLNGPQGNIRVISIRFRPSVYVCVMDPAWFIHLDTDFDRQKWKR